MCNRHAPLQHVAPARQHFAQQFDLLLLQVIIQLRKFAEKIQKSRGQGKVSGNEVGGQSSAAAQNTAKRMSLNTDVSQLLGTEIKGMDTSVAGAVLVPSPEAACVR